VKNELSEKIAEMIEIAVKDKQIELSKEEIREIVNELIPDLHRIVSEVVTGHLRGLAEHVLKTLKSSEET